MTAPSILETVPVCCPDETWEPIPDWPHEAGSCGRLRSIDRLGPDGVLQLGQMLPLHLDKRKGQGYEYGVLLDGKRRRKVHVAVAVLEAHRGLKPSPDLEARHGNGIRTDNHLTNLSWGTKIQNRGDREWHRIGLAGMNAWKIPVSPEPGLITIRQAIEAGWFPPTWSDPVKAFSNARWRAAKAGNPVPEAKARDGAAHLYDTVELVAFLRSVTGHLSVTPAACYVTDGPFSQRDGTLSIPRYGVTGDGLADTVRVPFLSTSPFRFLSLTSSLRSLRSLRDQRRSA